MPNWTDHLVFVYVYACYNYIFPLYQQLVPKKEKWRWRLGQDYQINSPFLSRCLLSCSRKILKPPHYRLSLIVFALFHLSFVWRFSLYAFFFFLYFLFPHSFFFNPHLQNWTKGCDRSAWHFCAVSRHLTTPFSYSPVDGCSIRPSIERSRFYFISFLFLLLTFQNQCNSVAFIDYDNASLPILHYALFLYSCYLPNLTM